MEINQFHQELIKDRFSIPPSVNEESHNDNQSKPEQIVQSNKSEDILKQQYRQCAGLISSNNLEQAILALPLTIQLSNLEQYQAEIILKLIETTTNDGIINQLLAHIPKQEKVENVAGPISKILNRLLSTGEDGLLLSKFSKTFKLNKESGTLGPTFENLLHNKLKLLFQLLAPIEDLYKFSDQKSILVQAITQHNASEEVLALLPDVWNTNPQDGRFLISHGAYKLFEAFIKKTQNWQSLFSQHLSSNHLMRIVGNSSKDFWNLLYNKDQDFVLNFLPETVNPDNISKDSYLFFLNKFPQERLYHHLPQNFDDLHLSSEVEEKFLRNMFWEAKAKNETNTFLEKFSQISLTTSSSTYLVNLVYSISRATENYEWFYDKLDPNFSAQQITPSFEKSFTSLILEDSELFFQKIHFSNFHELTRNEIGFLKSFVENHPDQIHILKIENRPLDEWLNQADFRGALSVEQIDSSHQIGPTLEDQILDFPIKPESIQKREHSGWMRVEVKRDPQDPTTYAYLRYDNPLEFKLVFRTTNLSKKAIIAYKKAHQFIPEYIASSSYPETQSETEANAPCIRPGGYREVYAGPNLESFDLPSLPKPIRDSIIGQRNFILLKLASQEIHHNHSHDRNMNVRFWVHDSNTSKSSDKNRTFFDLTQAIKYAQKHKMLLTPLVILRDWDSGISYQ